MTKQEAAQICQSIKFILDKEDYSEEVEEALNMAIEALEQAPKTGHWILKKDDEYEYCICSNCKHENGDNWANGSVIPYCWYCGARMESE